MKQLQILLIVGLLIAVGYTYKSLVGIEKDTVSSSANPSLAGTGEASQQPLSPANLQDFSEMIHDESETLSQLTEHPEEAQNRLKEIAQYLREEQVPILHEKALNTKLEGDERFLSVYILGESHLQKAQESLEQIAAEPIPKMPESRLTTQEEIIRGQAIEALREPEALKRVLSRADNKFLMDRAQRTLAYREGAVPNSPEEQDIEALNQILEKATRQ